MINTSQRLTEIAIRIVDIQIKKYTELSRIGIGPDAELSAHLARLQVDHLFAELEYFLSKEPITSLDTIHFTQILKFYMDCESLRGDAGWLLDSNTIHNAVYDRAKTQQTKLSEIYGTMAEWFEPHDGALSSDLLQFEFDSYSIAFRILDLVHRLKENPDRTDLGDDNNLGHGLAIMRRHARPGGRYHQADIDTEITQMHTRCKTYLEANKHLKKSTLLLTKASAETVGKEHQAKLLDAIGIYQEKFPEGTIESSDLEAQQIVRPKIDAPEEEHMGHWRNCLPSMKTLGFFALTAATVAVATITANHLLSDNGPEI